MAITYVRFVHSKIPPDWEARTFEDLDSGRHISLVDLVPEGTRTPLGRIYRDLDPALKVADCVVFRGTWPHIQHAVDDIVLRDEVGDRPAVGLVGGTRADQPGPSLIRLPGFRPFDQPLDLKALRQAELDALLQRTGAIFADDESHYGLPSTYHAQKFIRLADALRSLHDVSRVVDWVMEYVTSETIVVADTGSLQPLLFHLREEAARRFRWKVEIASLDGYPNDTIHINDAIDAIKNRPEIAWRLASAVEPAPGPTNWMEQVAVWWQRFVSSAKEEFQIFTRTRKRRRRGAHVPGAQPRFLFLVSVSSTGRLSKLFRELQIPESKILVVCETSKVPEQNQQGQHRHCDDYLVRIPIDRWEVDASGKCEHCEDQGKRIIRVDPISYELIPPEYEPKQIALNKDRAEAKRKFWGIASEMKAVRLHHNTDYSGNEKNRARHFSVYLDTIKLAEHGEFRRQCVEQLRTARPDIILIPYHTHSEMVKKLCFDAYGELPCFFVTASRLNEEVIDRLAQAERVLVADDAIVTGTTLVNLRAEVFRATQSRRHSPEVSAFVLICRPANKEPIKAMNRRYLGQEIKKLLKGEELFLPSGQQCPWCKEERLLRRFASRLEGTSLERATARLERLSGGAMVPPLLMVKDGDAQGDLITHGSLFGDLDHATGFAASSCASQTLKIELGTSGGVQLAVVDMGMAIDAYYEGPLLASMLRTFDRVDSRYLGVDPIIGEKIKGINPNQAYPGTLADLGLAALAGKVPGGELRKLLELERGNDQWIQMLADLYDIINPI